METRRLEKINAAPLPFKGMVRKGAVSKGGKNNDPLVPTSGGEGGPKTKDFEANKKCNESGDLSVTPCLMGKKTREEKTFPPRGSECEKRPAYIARTPLKIYWKVWERRGIISVQNLLLKADLWKEERSLHMLGGP